MARIIEINRPPETARSSRKWGIRLDGEIVGMIEAGQHYFLQTDESRHILELARYSNQGKFARIVAPAAVTVEPGENDCYVFAYASGAVWHKKLHLECIYSKPRDTKDALGNAISKYLIWLFFQLPKLKRLIGKHNCRKALGIYCGKDGVHIRWEKPVSGKIQTDGSEIVIPYRVTGLQIPSEALSDMDLRRMDYEIHAGIGGHTPWKRDKNDCFVIRRQ